MTMTVRTSSRLAESPVRRASVLVISLLVLSAAATAAGAQTIRQSPEAFFESPSLPFAPAAPTVAALKARAAATPAVHRLRSGEPIHTELQRWAEQGGWEFHWYPARSWKTMRDALIDKANVVDAVSEVIDILRSEGKPVQLRISDGNAVMEVLSTEVRNE
jgi:hypothetical protein